MACRWTCFAIAAVIGACGTDPDPRPATLDVVTLTILKPNCGQPQCHSRATQTEGIAFDTVEAARTSFDPEHLDVLNDNKFQDALAGITIRMPPDTPLSDEDLNLILRWIAAGGPGLKP